MILFLHTLLLRQCFGRRPAQCSLWCEVRRLHSPTCRWHKQPLMTFDNRANRAAASCLAAVARCYNDHCDEATVRRHTAFQTSQQSCFLDRHPSVVSMLLRARLQQRRYQRKAVGGAAQTTFRSLRVATRSSFAFFLCSSTVVIAPLVLLARPSTTAAFNAEAKPAIVHGLGCQPTEVAVARPSRGFPVGRSGGVREIAVAKCTLVDRSPRSRYECFRVWLIVAYY